MNSTFSKMAPYIKLLLDVLTGNRNSLSHFPSFLISFFPFLSLSPCSPCPSLAVCVSVSFSIQLKPQLSKPGFLLMCGGELFQLSRVSLSAVPRNLGTLVWKQQGGNFKKPVKSMEVPYLTGTNRRPRCKRRWTALIFLQVWDPGLPLGQEGNEQNWYQWFLFASPMLSHRIISFHEENKNRFKN